MIASVQYNDYKGTVAADEDDHINMSDYLEQNGIDTNRYQVVGVRLYGASGTPSCEFLCNDTQESKGIKFEKELNFDEFIKLFKRFEMVLTKNGIDFSDNTESITIGKQE